MKSNLILKIKIAVFILISYSGISFLYVANDAHIAFSYNIQDRGDIFQGGDGRFKFPFQNTGMQPLIISMVKSSCGCLIGYGPSEPVMAGEWDTIHGKYDTNRIGPINKSLTVYSNDSLQPRVVLGIRGCVKARPSHIKLYDKYDSTEIIINEGNFAEIKLADKKEVTIEIKNELAIDRKISWKVSESLRIESEQTITNTVRKYNEGTYANTILPAKETMIIKITILKTDDPLMNNYDYCNNLFAFAVDDVYLSIWLRNDRKH